VSVPRRLTEEQRRLLEEFESISDDDTYRHDESFFEKLKSAFR
jgi:DnaJ-class molecular chaperone